MSIKLEDIKKIAHSTPTAEYVFLSLDQRQRPRTVLNLDLFKRRMRENKIEYNEHDFFRTFREMEDIGVGNIEFGKRGKPTMFIWNYSLRDIAKAGLGDKQVSIKNAKIVVKDIKKVLNKKVNVPVAQLKYKVEDDRVMLSIPLEIFKH